MLLLCHYLQGTQDLDMCWIFVGRLTRLAIGIGLHASHPNEDQLKPLEKELRKRLWWGCVVLDRTLSMKLGRTPSIALADANAVEMPLEVDDQYIGDSSTTPRQPKGRPCRLAFFCRTIKLSEIICSALTRYPACHQTDGKMATDDSLRRNIEDSKVISNVILLDSQLLAWWEMLPAHLKCEPVWPDDIDFQRQRKALRFSFLDTRLLVQRPSFHLLVDDQFADDFTRAVAVASCNICISAAQETISLTQAHYSHQLLNALWYDHYCESC